MRKGARPRGRSVRPASAGSFFTLEQVARAVGGRVSGDEPAVPDVELGADTISSRFVETNGHPVPIEQNGRGAQQFENVAESRCPVIASGQHGGPAIAFVSHSLSNPPEGLR